MPTGKVPIKVHECLKKIVWSNLILAPTCMSILNLVYW